jgi:4-hydroxybenzoate polyprenyltransferase
VPAPRDGQVRGEEALDGQVVGGSGVLVKYANFVKLPHTLFALPFALVGVVLGSWYVDVTAATVGWVVVAFTAARFAAMGFNRIADREYDARNPRTAMREIPAGTMSVGEAWAAVIVASGLFLLAARLINPLCFALAPLALIWIFFYSYTKRFTRWSHLVLGLGLGIAPVGGFLAVTSAWSDPWWMLPVLAAAVMTWVAGFDIVYAMQDIDVDRGEGLHSVPATLGPVRAILISRVLHILAVTALALVGIVVRAGVFYFAGVAVSAALLAYEQVLVGRQQVQKAFFTVNMAMSGVFFVFVLLERMLPLSPLR